MMPVPNSHRGCELLVWEKDRPALGWLWLPQGRQILRPWVGMDLGYLVLPPVSRRGVQNLGPFIFSHTFLYSQLPFRLLFLQLSFQINDPICRQWSQDFLLFSIILWGKKRKKLTAQETWKNLLSCVPLRFSHIFRIY